MTRNITANDETFEAESNVVPFRARTNGDSGSVGRPEFALAA